MSSLFASQVNAEFLRQADTLTAIYDERGKVMGFFAPVTIELADKYAKFAAQLDPETVVKAGKETGPRRSTEELLQRLQAMG